MRIYIYIYINIYFMYICMYIYMYVCMYVCMHVQKIFLIFDFSMIISYFQPIKSYQGHQTKSIKTTCCAN